MQCTNTIRYIMVSSFFFFFSSSSLLFFFFSLQELVRAQDVEGQSALHLAAMHNNPQLAALLLAHGADPAQTNKEGSTPTEVGDETNTDRILMG